jgi:dihydroorotate dehydrogenase electron transfer subunit
MKTSLPQAARIVSMVDESPKVRTLILDLHLNAAPGQFVMAWLPGVDEKPFSLVGGDPITLTVARVGPFTTALFSLTPGAPLWLRGPLGHPFTLPIPNPQSLIPNPQSPISTIQSPTSNLQPPILLLAGGYGVAPLYFLAGRAVEAGWEVDCVIGAQTAVDVVFADRFAALGVGVTVTTDDGSLGEQGLATDAAARLLARTSYRAVYACGPEAMLDAVESLARAHSLPAQLSYERYMRCGFGVCGSCARTGWLVCRDGPVRSIPK